VFVLFRLRRRETADRALVERLARLARTLGLRRRVRLMVSARLAGPIAFGWIWPSVALPAGFAAQLDTVKQDAVLLHELAHLAAHDPFWNLLADAATMILWWHPAVWWMRRRLQLANELAADEASLLVADGPRVLAECLVQFGARLLERPVAGQIPVTGFRSHLGRRVQQLMRLEGGTWSPPRRLPAALVRSFGAAATAAAVVLCTAWATPREFTKGESMKTIQQNWKQSLAAFAFLAAINGQDAVGREAQSQPAAPAPAASAASAAPTPAAVPRLANADPQDVQQILQDPFQRSGNIRANNNNNRNPMLGTANPLIQGAIENPTPAAARALAASALVPASTNRIEAKLKSIVLDEVKPMENLPLSEVAKLLSQWAVKRDPEGIGVNFLMDFKQPSSPAPGARAVDPATGLPLAAAPAETVDLNAVGFRIPLPLHNVTLRDMLDILLKASERPIQYTVEEYGVLFSLKPEAGMAEPKPALAAAPERLSFRTFKVDTNTVEGALEHTFGISVSVNSAQGVDARSRAVRDAMKRLFHDRLRVALGQDSVFYNGQTGVLMVRASREDMEVVSAAMETLTGLESSRELRNPVTHLRQIELSDYFNGSLHEGWLPSTENGTTAQKILPMPLGVAAFGGVEFNVRGLIQLSGQTVKGYGANFPEQVLGIKVGQKCKRLHVLHAAGWANYVDDGVQIGRYVLHYADGSEREIPLINGDNVADWGGISTENPKHATVVWTGHNDTMDLRMFKTTWENPLPDQLIETIDYVSKMTAASPFLIAITAESDEPRREPPQPEAGTAGKEGGNARNKGPDQSGAGSRVAPPETAPKR
jgi:hypothetical protein